MTRTLVVGDIHGCYNELLDLLDHVGLDPDDRLISVGDLVNRGPDPVSVVRLFATRPNSVALRGNHEHEHMRGLRSLPFRLGRAQMGAFWEEFLPWAATLPTRYESPEVRVVHWACLPGVPLAEVPDCVCVGLPDGEVLLRSQLGATPWYERYDDEVPIAFGHRVMGSEPLVVRDRAFGLDTGACHGQRLSGLLLPERRVVSVPARADHWAIALESQPAGAHP